MFKLKSSSKSSHLVLAAAGLIALVLVTVSCGLIPPPQPPTTPTPAPRATASPTAFCYTTAGQVCCELSGQILCTVRPSPAPPRPTLAPTLAPTPVADFPRCQESVSSTCVEIPDHDPSKPAGSPSRYTNVVRRSMDAYVTAHPDQFDGAFFKFDSSGDGPSQDVFLGGVCAGLKQYSLDCCIDKDSGDIAVASRSFKPGDPSSFTEGFHPLSSWDPIGLRGRLVQAAPYNSRCTPRWF